MKRTSKKLACGLLLRRGMLNMFPLTRTRPYRLISPQGGHIDCTGEPTSELDSDTCFTTRQEAENAAALYMLKPGR